MVTTEPLPPAERLHPGNRAAVLASAVAAFATDPVFRWVWPDNERYQRCAPFMLGLLLDLRMAGGEVWTAGPSAAVAMWNPPGGLYAEPAEDPWPAVHAAYTPVEEARWAAFDELAAIPSGGQPYWYLGVLACAPDHQRRGLASAVLAPVLAAADRTGTPAYLETVNPGNLDFYARHGFAVTSEINTPDGGPLGWLMRRDPAALDG